MSSTLRERKKCCVKNNTKAAVPVGFMLVITAATGTRFVALVDEKTGVAVLLEVSTSVRDKNISEDNEAAVLAGWMVLVAVDLVRDVSAERFVTLGADSVGDAR